MGPRIARPGRRQRLRPRWRAVVTSPAALRLGQPLARVALRRDALGRDREVQPRVGDRFTLVFEEVTHRGSRILRDWSGAWAGGRPSAGALPRGAAARTASRGNGCACRAGPRAGTGP